MAIKYFCDKCGNELTAQELHYCNEMIGYGHFCREHMPKQENVIYKKAWDQDRFKKTIKSIR